MTKIEMIALIIFGFSFYIIFGFIIPYFIKRNNDETKTPWKQVSKSFC
jgi:hypothetical protein